jgi:hypothetical protein
MLLAVLLVFQKLYAQERLRKTKYLKMYGLTWVIHHEMSS